MDIASMSMKSLSVTANGTELTFTVTERNNQYERRTTNKRPCPLFNINDMYIHLFPLNLRLLRAQTNK